MGITVRHNVAAMNSWRNLSDTNDRIKKSLERLSSGKRINRGSDDPAGLVISEQMRAKVKSLEQATSNSELAVSMVQTAEASMAEVNNILVRMRQLALHASNEGGNDDKMLAADQAEIDNALSTINQISAETEFGTRKLLDGSHAITGLAAGDGIEFIKASEKTKVSPADGYEVNLMQSATKAHIEGTAPMSAEELAQGGVKISLMENGKKFNYVTRVGETMESLVTELQSKLKANGLDLEAGVTADNRLYIEHLYYGSDPSFGVMSTSASLLGTKANTWIEAIQGTDVQGTIGGELAYGQGQYLTGGSGTRAEGLVLKITGDPAPQVEVKDAAGNIMEDPETGDPMMKEGAPEGTVYVTNNALHFQVGPSQDQTSSIELPNLNSRVLGRDIKNDSGYASLSDIDLTTFQGAQDALLIIDASIDKISQSRGQLGAFQKNTLESNISNLRYTTENLSSAESGIRDADMAKEISNFTQQQILMASDVAMLSQANQFPKALLQLLGTGR